MTFTVEARSYARYMGRYSDPLAVELVRWAGIEPGRRALDVGCGPGALAAALAARVGAGNVAAVDPSRSLLSACLERVPGVDARHASAESLPWPDASFDAVMAQLVLNFVDDGEAVVREMRRVARPGGVVASCTWDYADGMQMLRVFWDAALELDPTAPDEGRSMRHCSEGELEALWRQAGLIDVSTGPLDVSVTYEGFDDFWEPFTLGVGPGGAYVSSLTPQRRDALRDGCSRRLRSAQGPFALHARAFAVRGHRPG